MPGFDYVTYNDVDELRTKVKDARGGLLGKGKSRLAAIMLEPLQGEGGITPASREFFAAARQLCDEGSVSAEHVAGAVSAFECKVARRNGEGCAREHRLRGHFSIGP